MDLVKRLRLGPPADLAGEGWDLVTEAADKIEDMSTALRRISDGETDELSSDPLQWPSTVAFLALGGKVENGQRVYMIQEEGVK